MEEDNTIHSVHRHYLGLAMVLALLLTVYHVAMVQKFGVAPVDGSTYFLMDDDPMISMRYGRNLAHGIGLVYNEGEQVEGFTNPLFTFLCAGLHLLDVPEPTLPVFVHLTNLLLSIGIMLMLIWFWGDSPRARCAGLAAALFYVTQPAHSYYAHGGFETYMVIFILVFALWRIERLGPAGALVVGLLPLTHATALPMWAALVAGILWVNQRSPASRILLILVAMIPAAGYEAFRIAYYETVLPNTYWLKAGAGSLSQGIHYTNGWLRSIWPLVPLGVYTLLALPHRKTILVVAVLIVHLVAVSALGGDIFPQYRFLFPCSVLLAALAGASLPLLWRYFAYMSRGERVYFGAVLAALMFLALIREPLAEYRFQSPQYVEDKSWNIQHLALGLALRANTTPDTVVGLFGLGHAGYYGQRSTVDMLGKADAHIARVPPIPRRLVGHNKVDFDYVIGQRRPDLVELELSPDELKDTVRLQQVSHTSIWGYDSDLALHGAFRTEYGGHPITDAQRRFLGFYARGAAGNSAWNIPEEFFLHYPRDKTVCRVESAVSTEGGAP